MKKKIMKSLNLIKKSYERFPIFLLLVTFTTLFLTIVINTKLVDKVNFERILTFIALISSGTLFIETKYYKGNFMKLILCFVAAIISGTLINFDLFGNPLRYVISRLEVSYVVLCIILSIDILYKKSKMEINEYMTKVFINLVRVSVAYLILALCTTLVGSVFYYLIFKSESLILKLNILIFGLFYIPNILYSFVNFSKEDNNFIKSLIKYLIFSQVIASYIILYLYIGKIIILRNIPQNELFNIASFLFVISFFICSMVSYIKENKINKILIPLFIPFILLQIYALGIRIINYGITPSRYFGIMIILFEIIYEIIYLFRKELKNHIFTIIGIFALIGGVIPFVNMYDISDYSQYHRMLLYKNKKNLTTSDKKKIYGAYKYLKESDTGKKYINDNLTYRDRFTIEEYEYLETVKEESIYANKEVEKLDIKGYSKLQMFTIEKDNINESFDKVFENVEIESKKLNISDAIKSYIEHNEDIEKFFNDNNEIQVDKNNRLILNSINIYYIDDIVNYYEITGYLLEK